VQKLALWFLAFVASAVIGTHGIAYWDAGDYTLLAITGGKSGLLLGRPLFLWVSRAVLAAGVDPENAETVLRWFWSGVGATSAPLLTVLATRLGLDGRSALVAGAALALSPSFAHTSHQVLTDAPALALSIAALACAAGRQPVRAGALMAAAIATRETAAIHLVAMVMLLAGRRAALQGRQQPGLKPRPTDALRSLAACAIGLGLIIVAAPPAGMGQWLGAMSQSARAHPWSAVDLLTALAWVFAAGPAPVAIGAWILMRGEISRRVRIVVIPAAVGTLLLLFYPDGSFSPRYVLATVPVAFFIAAAPWLASRFTIAAAVLVVPLVAAALPAARANAVAAQGATLNERIPALPENAVVVPGHFCPQARLAAAIAKRPDLRFVCPGWDWPPDVAGALDSALKQGVAIAVDVREIAWVGRREEAPRDAIRAWLQFKQFRPVADFSVVGQ